MDSKNEKRNIIMITLDGARYDRIKCMSNLIKLSKEGTFFSQMITYAPYTIASLHAIFSGAYGNRNGVDNYYGTYSFKKESFATITDYLKKGGYYTIGDILNPLVIPKQSFDELCIHDEYKDDLTLKHSRLLEKVYKLNKEGKPCFLFLHYSKIHTDIKLNISKRYSNFSQEYFNKKEENIRHYDSYLIKADEYLGTILDKIKSLNLEKSIILINSDHGISIGERLGEKSYGVFCYDYTLRTFSLFYQPDLFPKKEISQLVRTVDILPTILDYLQIKEFNSYEKMDGKSMKLLIQGKKENREAFSESGNPNFTTPPQPPKVPNCRAYRDKKWKFIHNYWDDSEELYNLEKDPNEIINLINKEEKISKQFRRKLNQELKKGLFLSLKKVRI